MLYMACPLSNSVNRIQRQFPQFSIYIFYFSLLSFLSSRKHSTAIFDIYPFVTFIITTTCRAKKNRATISQYPLKIKLKLFCTRHLSRAPTKKKIIPSNTSISECKSFIIDSETNKWGRWRVEEKFYK